jgi:hypothetical protein
MDITDEIFNLPPNGVLYVEDHLRYNTDQMLVAGRAVAIHRDKLPKKLRRLDVLRALSAAVEHAVNGEIVRPPGGNPAVVVERAV